MAANTNTSVDISGMLAAQSSFETAVGDADSSYTSMQSQIDALRSSWSGDAANTYQIAMDNWLADFNTVRTQLSLMLQKLQANTGTYDTTHQGTSDTATVLAKTMSDPLPGF
ncbi:WXG100 family type VII secretion target [Streptomyces ziwulingensis]|uniref:WXG100 family type VII secretion target n=1 Tax=Streptomyces ziwulingensis TaxID=1045501 RepID=A0ABP9BF46_9ACTN